MAGMAAPASIWSRVEAFAELCRDVGGEGGVGGVAWAAQVDALLDAVPLSVLLSELERLSGVGASEQVDTLCLVLKHVLVSARGARELSGDERFSPSLAQGLGHYSVKVRALTARQLRRIGLASFPAASRRVLCAALCGSLHDVETGVSSDAAEALVAWSRAGREERRALLRELSASKLGPGSLPAALRADASVALLRACAVVGRVCARGAAGETDGGDQSVADVRAEGLLAPLLGIVSGDDVLLQLNALRLLPLLSASRAGLAALVEAGVVDALSALAGLGGRDELGGPAAADAFLGEEALRAMAQLSARMLESSPGGAEALALSFLRAVEQRLAADVASPVVMRSAEVAGTVDLLGAFAGAMPPRSLQLVNARPEALVRPWMRLAAKAGDRVTVAGLASVAAALRGGELALGGGTLAGGGSADDVEHAALLEQSRVQPSPAGRAEAAGQGQALFEAFCAALNGRLRTVPGRDQELSAAEGVLVVMDLLRQPFDEQRCACYALLRSLAAQDNAWGLRAIYGAGAEVELALMDRNLAMSKHAKEWRFAVLEAVHANPHSAAVLGPQRHSLLRAFLRRGPYLGPQTSPVPQVMTAEAS
jgi:hypothetical protein